MDEVERCRRIAELYTYKPPPPPWIDRVWAELWPFAVITGIVFSMIALIELSKRML